MCKDFSRENRPIWAERPRIPYIQKYPPPPPGCSGAEDAQYTSIMSWHVNDDGCVGGDLLGKLF